VLCGLWPLERGRITRLPAEEILYIPQQPYLSYGSLRDQVIYPHSPLDFEAKGTTDSPLLPHATCPPTPQIATTSGCVDPSVMVRGTGTSTEQLENIMHSLNLYYLVQREGWDKVSDWNEALSGGEKQRLVLARCVLLTLVA
jgi:ATP-binding cassette subfamily D (ALD) long-chain fatty acid import protein